MDAGKFIRDPEHRVKAAWTMLVSALIGWPTTHVLMLVTQPQGFTSWAAHLLLAISWLSIIYTAVNIIATTDVRREQQR